MTRSLHLTDSVASQNDDIPPYMKLAQQALETAAGEAILSLLVANHAAVTALAEVDRLPSTEQEPEGLNADYLAALEAVAASGSWKRLALEAVETAADPAALVQEATKPYRQNLRLLCNHVLTRRSALGLDVALDPTTLALAATAPEFAVARLVAPPAAN